MSKPALNRKANRESHSRSTAHRAVEESCRRLASILQSSPLAIVALDAHGTVQTWNPAAEQMFGWAREEVLGQPLPVVPQDGEVLYRNRWVTLLDSAACTGEQVTSRKKDGSLFLAGVSSAPLLDANGHVEGFLYIFDVPKDSPRGLATGHPKAEVIGELPRLLSHELNNSIGAILGWAEMALDGLGRQSPLRKPLNHILQQARHANDIIQDLAAFSGTQTLQMYKVDLNHIVEQAMDCLAARLPRSVVLEKNLVSNLPRVLADPQQIERALIHICRYALAAVPEGGSLRIETRQTAIRGKTDLDLAGIPPGNYVVLCVSHPGLQSEPETLPHICEPLFGLSGAGNGSAMALAAACGIVKQHGGWIRASSEPACGTRFTVYFPLPSLPFSLLRRQTHDEE